MDNKKQLRTALIGVGVMGKKYASMLCGSDVKSLVLTAAVSRHEEIDIWLKSLNPEIKIYKSSDELFDNAEDIDAVIIATPHKSHREIAEKAFSLGIDVLCDKPAGITISQANAMSKAAEKSGKVYAMMFHQRLYPKYQKIKEILDGGELGKIERIMLINSRYFRTAFYHRSGSWRSSWNGEGGGALINQGQHILDIWQWLFGMPEKIYADVQFGKYNNFLVDDEATIHMQYKDKVTAVFMLTTGEVYSQERLEITLSKGKILLLDDTLHIIRFSEDCRSYIKNAGTTSRENIEITEEIINFEKSGEPYEQMLENFAQSVLSNTSPIADGRDAVNPLMLTNAAYYSAVKGECVALPLDEKKYDELLSELCEKEG